MRRGALSGRGVLEGPSHLEVHAGAFLVAQAIPRRLGPILHHFEGIFEHFRKYSGCQALQCQNVAQNVDPPPKI